MKSTTPTDAAKTTNDAAMGYTEESDHVSTNGRLNTSDERSALRKAYDIVFWTPPRCRWDPEKPPVFSMGMNVLFAFAGAFTVANLYYNHPILNILADDFNVPYGKFSFQKPK